MGLQEYARKRSFDATPEPPAQASSRPRKADAPIFVVQLHHARTRHYDLRLEADGVLKSWAVPKGPSMRSGERRLAIEVEDHPLEYAGFEGTIPRGQYGAGEVEIFDGGTWEPEGDPLDGIAAGRLDFLLHGERFHGRFTLVRTDADARQPQWMLIRRTVNAPVPARPTGRTTVARRPDWRRRARALAGARVVDMPDDVVPQLATLRRHPPRGEGWLHEIKWDGYRLLAYRGDRVELLSRNRLPWSQRLPRLAGELAALPVRQAILDGELIAVDRHGRSDFSALQRLLERGRTDDLRYVAFDLLYIDGVDLRGVAQLGRRGLLSELLMQAASPMLAFSEHVDGDPSEILEASARIGIEGIVCKHADAAYQGGRSQAWIKLKHVADESFVVVGYTPPTNTRQGFGSLLLACREAEGLRYAGRVGSGFSDEDLGSISRRLHGLHTTIAPVELPAHVPFTLRSVQWVRPVLMVDVHTRGRGKEGLVRQASFQRLRHDLPPRGSWRCRDTGHVTGSAEEPMKPRLSSPDRVVYPDTGLTKRDIADYYSAVAQWLLPELVDRPLSLVRCPDGIQGECFFQRHHKDRLGQGVHPVLLDEHDGKDEYLYVRGIEGVLSLVQMNAIEFHPWGAKRKSPDRPDRLVFDLDPGEGVPWAEVVRAARDVRDRLAEVGLQSWPRLSGGKGIHVCVPLKQGQGWDEAKDFCEAFAKVMARQSPARYVAKSAMKIRSGRIFIDWLRNGRGATSVSGWVLRARKGAPVAMPLRWVSAAEKIASFK